MLVWRGIEKISDILETILKISIIFSLGAVAFFVNLAVLFRYVLASPLTWTTEISSYLLVYTVLFGASIALRHNQFVKVEALSNLLPSRLRTAIAVGSQLLIAIFLVICIESPSLLIQKAIITNLFRIHQYRGDYFEPGTRKKGSGKERMIASIFTLLLILGIPIAFVLGISSVFYLWKAEMPFVLVSQRVFVGLDNFLLLAVPLFILAGKLMNASGITNRLVNFFYILIGHIRGGLAYVNIIASIFFAGITGAGAADTAAIGSIMIPAMKKEGYSSEYSGAVTAISSTIGPTIPPSIAMVVYGAISEASIARLFLAGFIPGLLLGFAQLVVAAFYARRQKFPVREKILSFRTVTEGFFNTLLAILMPRHSMP
jgi:TRAP-type mannitol/chloroaromatic compound transport system permease small subunit